MSESKFHHITPTWKLVCMPSVAKAMTAAKRGVYIWLDYCEPSREELSELIQPLGLHPLAIEDCTDTNQIPKIDDYPHHTFMLFNSLQYTGHKLSIYEVDVFIGPNFIVTVHQRDTDGCPVLEELERQVQLQRDSVRQGPAYLLHVLLDLIVDRKFVEIEKLEEELVQSEEAVLADPSHFDSAALLHLRRDLLSARKSLYYEREILVKICRKDCPFIR